MPLPTEPIGSIPRPTELLAAMSAYTTGGISREQLHASENAALRETSARFERTGSPVISDGEQTKPSFATYSPSGLSNLAAAGVVIPFADGHPRQLTTLTAGPVESLGTTDDCGFSPFADETSTTRDTAFAKVKSRVEGTLMASNILKV